MINLFRIKNIITIIITLSLLASCSLKSKTKNYKKTIETGDKNIPGLNGPEVRRVWVPDKIEGNKLIKGHFIYIIKKNSTWRL